ncbi:MAG: two-component regulator propeller domain-containing protein [Bacteroidales bacterium]|nr:two-component regulator propeller domain-containing protein [Bacteroidales bacterium]
MYPEHQAGTPTTTGSPHLNGPAKAGTDGQAYRSAYTSLVRIFLAGLLLLLLCAGHMVMAQGLPTYRFQYLQIEDGLPQNTITSIARDNHGFMWFGTNNGVSRYDSYTFERFGADGSAQESLPDNLVHAIAADSNNRVWIGSSRGLSWYDPGTGSIHRFTDTAATGAVIDGVNSLVVRGHHIWAGSARSGIFRITYDNNNYRITAHYSPAAGNLPVGQVNVIFGDARGQLYAGGNQAAYVHDTLADAFVIPADNRALPPDTWVNDIFVDDSEQLYYSTRNGLFVHADSTLTWYPPDPQDPRALGHGTVNMVRQGVKGRVLVATLGGLYAFDPVGGDFLAFPRQGHEYFVINNEFINTLYCDTLGNVWVGTEKGGINKFNVYQHPFMHLTNDPNNPNSLNVNTVNSVYSEQEDLWIGTAGGGLNHHNLKTGQFTHYTSNPQDPATISSDYVSSIQRGSDGYLWAGTWGEGLNAARRSGGRLRFDRITADDQRYTNSEIDAFVSTLVDDPEGYLLIGTEGGLWMLNYASRHFTSLLAPDDMEHDLQEIGCALLDSRGYFWIGTREGLFRFPRTSLRPTRDNEYIISRLQYFKHVPGDDSSLPGDYVISLMEDSGGDIWIGTYGNGLAKASVGTRGNLECTHYSVEEGLSNNVVYGILEDRMGRIWMSTDNGLSMLEPESRNIRQFFLHDGLLNNQFYWSAAHESEFGTMYFGGTEGLDYFNPARFYDYTYLPDPKITSLRIHNQEVNPGAEFDNRVAIEHPVYAADTIHLTYKSNNISIEFSAFDYYLPGKSRYAYMLTGVDKDWVNVTADRRFANYNYLEGDTYKFLLKASNGDGLWNETPREVTIIVTPPFWKTPWFVAAMIATFGLLLFLVIRLQIRRIVVQKKLLEEKVQQRTREIEEQKILLEKQARELIENNQKLAQRGLQIEQQKKELESKNDEISSQRDELILLNEKVNEINQMQLRFFTNVSHEFQTPLTLIVSPVERLLQKFNGDPETAHMLQIVRRNAKRLLMLIRQLLEIRKIETGHQVLQVELTDVNAFLHEIFESFEELAAKNNITFGSNLEISRPAWIDKEKMENVVYNLLSNAFKFTPSGESVMLEASTLKRENGDYLSITIRDTGEGIPPEKAGMLYERFLQLTDSRKHLRAGAGIGLSMVKSLAELMHGSISFTSEPGKGSAFTVEVPIDKHAFGEHEIDTTGQVFESNIRDRVAVLFDQIVQPAAAEYNNTDNAVETILVVEDNADMRSFIASNLSQYYRVEEAENGTEGYRKAQKTPPTVIISDIMMPGMDGMELTRKIKKNLYTSHIPVVLLTARSETRDQVKGLEAGADDYVTKPFDIEVLAARVRTLISNRNRVMEKFSRLEDVAPDDMGLSALDRKFYAKADEIVRKYYAEPAFDVDQFASEMLVSRSQLYNKLKAITNLSANEFINTYRLKRAWELLAEKEKQISEIAYETGFNDPKYFSRIFRKYYHKSPSEVLKG